MSFFEILFWFWLGAAPSWLFGYGFTTKEFWIFVIPVIILGTSLD